MANVQRTHRLQNRGLMVRLIARAEARARSVFSAGPRVPQN
jgi:hypothetical protein